MPKSSKAIKKEAERFFTEFLTRKPPDYEAPSVESLESLLQFRYSEEHKVSLIKEVTAEKVKAVIFNMSSNKSPDTLLNSSKQPDQ